MCSARPSAGSGGAGEEPEQKGGEKNKSSRVSQRLCSLRVNKIWIPTHKFGFPKYVTARANKPTVLLVLCFCRSSSHSPSFSEERTTQTKLSPDQTSVARQGSRTSPGPRTPHAERYFAGKSGRFFRRGSSQAQEGRRPRTATLLPRIQLSKTGSQSQPRDTSSTLPRSVPRAAAGCRSLWGGSTYICHVCFNR